MGPGHGVGGRKKTEEEPHHLPAHQRFGLRDSGPRPPFQQLRLGGGRAIHLRPGARRPGQEPGDLRRPQKERHAHRRALGVAGHVPDLRRRRGADAVSAVSCLRPRQVRRDQRRQELSVLFAPPLCLLSQKPERGRRDALSVSGLSRLVLRGLSAGKDAPDSERMSPLRGHGLQQHQKLLLRALHRPVRECCPAGSEVVAGS
mmetsp:Transcript_7848/g.16377  ORF Transcript_7848/g.16377 Transcript_7848/m.16377 type:complete len:202 (-) Transcript_7848:166-771(-)